jgi:hypothetical protein
VNSEYKIDPGLQPTADILFSQPQDERVNYDEKDLVELFPYGLSLSNDATRPFMILKDKSGDLNLPVPLNQLEAGATLSQSNPQFAGTTNLHSFSEELLRSLDIKLERCLFVEIRGGHQYVRLYMQGHPQFHSMKFRADMVMSLCLHLKVPFFAAKNFIERSKLMAAEIKGQALAMAANPLALSKPHHYLM